MNADDLRKRFQRLDALSRGFSREVLAWKAAKDPLLYGERQAYIQAIQDTIAGLESARVVLAKTIDRLTA